MREKEKVLNTSKRVLTSRAVGEITGLSRTTIWRMERAGKFPARRQIGPRRIGYIEGEVLAWADSLPAVGG